MLVRLQSRGFWLKGGWLVGIDEEKHACISRKGEKYFGGWLGQVRLAINDL